MSHANPCHCGKPIPDTANLCPDCAGTLRRDLYKIADRWDVLEQALRWRNIIPGAIGVRYDDGPADVANGERRVVLATGTSINEAAVNARRKATDAVWFAAQVIRDDYDANSWDLEQPRTKGNRTQDDTPAVARWLAANHVDHVTKRADRETAEEISQDIARAERAVYRATHPSGIHWTPVNLSCDMWATSDQGERVPCHGDMWALVGNDVMPDLVCDADETHTIAPGEWERSGWKRRLKMPLDPAGMARLADKMR